MKTTFFVTILSLSFSLHAQSSLDTKRDTFEILKTRAFDFISLNFDSLNTENFDILRKGRKNFIEFRIVPVKAADKWIAYQTSEFIPFIRFMSTKPDNSHQKWRNSKRDLVFGNYQHDIERKELVLTIFPFVKKDDALFLWIQGLSPGIMDGVSTNLFFRFNSKFEIDAIQIMDIVH